MQDDLAPVVLFVYNRPHHTLQTLTALQQNEGAGESMLYIYSDGPKTTANPDELNKIKEVRQIIRRQEWCGKVIIRESEQNLGLAKSVIKGVTEVINEHEKVIVLEDDLITNVHFLSYMNFALDKYKTNDKVAQVTGYFPNKKNYKGKNSSFLLPVTSTWGWGTWKKNWNNVDFEPSDFDVLKNDKYLKKSFNLDGTYDYYKMLKSQLEYKTISSWGILFWWDTFKKKHLVLFPDKTLVLNIGFDGSGVHCDSNEKKIVDFDPHYEIKKFPTIVKESKKDFAKFKSYIKAEQSSPFIHRFKRYIYNKLK